MIETQRETMSANMHYEHKSRIENMNMAFLRSLQFKQASWKTCMILTQVTLTSGKDRVWFSDDDEGRRLSGESLSNCEPRSPGVCGGVGFLGDGLRLLSELGVAGVRLTENTRKGVKKLGNTYENNCAAAVTTVSHSRYLVIISAIIKSSSYKKHICNRLQFSIFY